MSTRPSPLLSLNGLPTLPVRGTVLRDRLAWALHPASSVNPRSAATTPLEHEVGVYEFFLAFASFVEAIELTGANGDAEVMRQLDDVMAMAGRLAGYDVHDVFDANRDLIASVGADFDLVAHVESLLAASERNASEALANAGFALLSRFDHAHRALEAFVRRQRERATPVAIEQAGWGENQRKTTHRRERAFGYYGGKIKIADDFDHLPDDVLGLFEGT